MDCAGEAWFERTVTLPDEAAGMIIVEMGKQQQADVLRLKTVLPDMLVYEQLVMRILMPQARIEKDQLIARLHQEGIDMDEQRSRAVAGIVKLGVKGNEFFRSVNRKGTFIQG